MGHGRDIRAAQDVGGRDADKDVRAAERLGEGAGVRLRGMPALVVVEVGARFGERPLGVAHHQIADAGGLAHVGDADASRARAIDDDAQIGEAAVAQQRVVHQSGEGDDGGAPLVVVEDGDVEHGVQTVLDLKAGGRGDVLEIDAAVHRREGGDDVDDPLRIGAAGIGAASAAAGERHGPGIDIAKRLEQDSLALHHRNTGQRAQIAQAEDGGPV